MLFDKTIFGPIKSRRLGVSLGINLLPNNAKICSFDCIYCECGYNFSTEGAKTPTREEVKQALEEVLSEMQKKNEHLDVITFAGNGEPTLHKDFSEIIDDTIELKNKYFPNTKVSVLSNSTEIAKKDVFEALHKVDNNILKLDSAIQKTIDILNQPNLKSFTVEKLIENLKRFNGNLIIQTMFLRGEHNGEKIDNTTPEEIEAWLNALKEIRPQKIMIYSIDRATPEKKLTKISSQELESIAKKAQSLGFEIQVSN